jgi:Family of unknown function (DUF6328)
MPQQNEQDHLQGQQPDEDEKERVDRELIELLNELRVALPGVQVLFAFLLTVPFQSTFEQLTVVQEAAYLGSFLAAALGTILLIAPSSYHRLRFRHGDKERMLLTSNRLVLAGMGFVAVAITGAVFVIIDLVLGMPAASILTALIAGWFVWFWYGLPISRMLTDRRREGR